MKSIAPGLREADRILARFGRRLNLAWQRRKLGRLESELGLLGWQQADYDTGTQQHVDRLNDFERTQGQLNNESAALGLTVQQLEERRASEEATFERQRAERAAARDPLVKALEEAEQTFTARQREHEELVGRVVTLDREIEATEEEYRSILAQGAMDDDKAEEVHHLLRRLSAMQRERHEWQAKIDAFVPLIANLETDVQQYRAMVSVETEAARKLERDFAESDEALGKQIAAQKREKQKLERRINDLEKAKTQPYREIGRVLADQEIAPMNQPEALAAVLAQREKIAVLDTRQEASLARSRQEDRRAVWGSWVLLLVFAVLVGVGSWRLVQFVQIQFR